MNVTDYFNSLPMDTRYYLLDYSAEPNKIKEVIGDRAKDSAFFTKLMKYIQATQDKRIRDAKQHVAEQQQKLENEFRPHMDIGMDMDVDVHDAKLNIQYTCDKMAKTDPDYFISIADELVRFISKLKSDLTNVSENYDYEDYDTDSTNVGNIARAIASSDIGRES